MTQVEPIGQDRLRVIFNDMDVEDPHLFTVRLINDGPADVASNHFDAGQPLIVQLDRTIFGLTKESGSQPISASEPGSKGVIHLGPGLLKKGETWTAEAVVGGKPTATLSSSLIDTDISNVVREREDYSRYRAPATAAISGLTTLALIAAVPVMTTIVLLVTQRLLPSPHVTIAISPAPIVSPSTANCQSKSTGLPPSSYGTYIGQLSDGTAVTFTLHQADSAGIVGTSKTPDGTKYLQYIRLDSSGHELKVNNEDSYIWVSFASDCRSLMVTKDSANRTGNFTKQ
jgi:hypothetical protein